MRRSFSTSDCEYNRVPLGERRGLDQPALLVHPQRLRMHLCKLSRDRNHEDAAIV